MRLRNIIMAGLILLILAFTAGTGMADANQTIADNATNNTDQINATAGNATTDGTVADEEELDDIEEYEGSVGPGNALYGLKIAFENIDETFTFNESEKLGKQVAHARLRIAELKAELRKKNNEAADKALEEYQEKIKNAEIIITKASDKDTGLRNAQINIVKHQEVLKILLESNSNNTGLARAYNDSIELEKKFESKTKMKLERKLAKNGRKMLKQIETEEIEEETGIKAEISDNIAEVKVKVKLVSNSTEKNAIAQETLSRLKMSKEAIGNLLKLEEEETTTPTPTVTVTGTPTSTLTATENATATATPAATPGIESKEKLEVKANIEGNITEIKVEYKFTLNAASRDEVIDGIYNKLSTLTADYILDSLDIKEEHKETEKSEKEKRVEKKKEKREGEGPEEED